MTKIIYTALTSLDGYIEDPGGSFDWAMPDAEVHQFANDLETVDDHRFSSGVVHLHHRTRTDR